MEREQVINELIGKVSVLYRQQRDKVNQAKRRVFEIEDQLKDTTIPYKVYMKLQDDLAYLKQDFQKELNIADGIELAREKLFE